MIPHLQSPLWYGQAQLLLNSPSLGLYNVWVGAQAYPFPYAVFQRVQFPVSPEISQRLAGDFSDLQVTLQLTGGAGTYLLDNLRFISNDEAASPVAQLKNGPILGLEHADQWVAFQPTELADSDIRTQGAHSLAISNFSWTRVQSAPLGSGAVGPFVSFDFRIPSPQKPGWRGTVDLLVSIPSKGVNDVRIGTQDLASLPVDMLTRVTFSLPTDVHSALEQTYNDLSFVFVVNVPWGQTGNYLIDNLRYQDDAVGDPQRPEVSFKGTPQVAPAITATPMPTLEGSGAAAVESAMKFIDWMAGAQSDQIVPARRVIYAAARNADIVHALINEIDLNYLVPLDRYLVTLSILGEMQSPIAEDFFLSVLAMRSSPSNAAPTQSQNVLPSLQSKAVDCLAFMKTARSNAALLQAIQQHPSAMVRVEAIRAYLDNNGARGRADVLAVIQANEANVPDYFDHLSETDRSVAFDDKMKTYLAKHPALGNPAGGVK